MKRSTVFPAILLAALLCYGLFRLFAIRFASGDIYAPYSSYRADGLGTKALHDSLAELMPVERNLLPLSKLAPDNAVTLFMAGVSNERWSSSFSGMDDLKSLVHGGDRLILTFLPLGRKPVAMMSPVATATPVEGDDKDVEKSGTTPVARKKKKAEDDDDEKEEIVDWFKSWDVKPGYFKEPPVNARAVITNAEPGISWHTALYFDHPGDAWKTLYNSMEKPVVIERSFGRGSIVLVADSYLLSNEALSKDRAPLFLSMLVGSAGRVVFDETHLGVSENPGLAALVRGYRLHGAVVALLIVAALFVWSNAIPLVPPGAGRGGRSQAIEGRDAATGFVSLLKRNIPPRELVAACVAEWKHSSGRRVKAADIARVDAFAADGARQPVKTFQTIARFLTQRK